MIWYRHWLELRYRALVVTLLPLLSAVFFLFILHSPDMREQDSSSLAREWPRFAEYLPAMGAERFVVWTAHVVSSGFVSLLAAIAVLGSVNSSRHAAGPLGSMYYTLSLPAARFKWVWTRLVAGLAVVAGANLALLVIHSALVLATGHTAPWGAMLRTSAFAALSGLPFLAVFQPFLSRAFALPLTLFSLVWAPAYTGDAAAGQPVLWAYIAVGIAGFGLSCWSVARRDF